MAVLALVRRHGWNATARQILNPGIEHWIGLGGRAAVGYVDVRAAPWGGRRRVAAGEPVCAESDVEAAAAAFEADARRDGARATWFAADERLRVAREGRPGWSTFPVGAQPVWSADALAARFREKASLRAQVHRARNKGVAVEAWPSALATRHPALADALARWLGSRGLPPLHFLVEPDTLDDLTDRHVWVARRGETVVGFTVWSAVPARDGWLVEQLIRVPGAPNGTSELLLATAAEASAGAPFVTLGLAPLDGAAPGGWLGRLFATMRRSASGFYDFDGLARFKAKFVPERWDTLWALTDEPRPSVATLYAVADAFAGPRSPAGLVARAVGHRLRRVRG